MKKQKIQKTVKKIGLHVNRIEDAFSKFSYEDNYILDNEMIDYIERNAQVKKGMELDKFEIDIYCPNEIKNEDKELFVASYKQHYEMKKMIMHKALHRNNVVAGLLFLFAALILVATHVLNAWFITIPEILSFTLEIASWVFMWESVDAFFFTRNKELLDIALYDLLDAAEIRFIFETKNVLLD